VDATPDARDTLSRFERWCRHPAQAALLLFGLVNGGVPLQVLYWTVWTIPLLGFLAKPIGLILGVGLAVPLGLILPRRIGLPELAVVGLIASIGFTGALFFATAAVGPGPTLSTLKMSALLTILGAPFAVVAAAALGVGRFGR
jgi:Na+/H+ antiporter NhaA